MGERILKILLSELRLIRLRCRTCQQEAVIEVSIRDLGSNRVLASGRCPFCQNVIRPPQATNPFELLAQALNGLDQLEKLVDVEFVVPLEDKP